jgi:hypothetical protein
VETVKDIINNNYNNPTNFKYKLLTQKAADFILFTKVVKIIDLKTQLTA